MNKCKVCGKSTEDQIDICDNCYQKPMMLIYYNHGNIRKEDIYIEVLTISDIESIRDSGDDYDTLCSVVPLEFIEEKINNYKKTIR